MSYDIENTATAELRRAKIRGNVDFTMMYVAHDAFNRDLSRLLMAAAAGRALSPAAVATWRIFSKQLHIHHNAEDTSLWPRLHTVVSDPAERQILDDMEHEHASLDPRLDQVEAAMVNRNEKALVDGLKLLAEGLPQHMRHEEEEALPLLERRLGEPGWAAFGKEIRGQQGGLKGAAQYLPWVLDASNPTYAAAFLGMLPPPARLLYRTRWLPKYRAAELLR